MYFHDICGAKLDNIEISECPECLCSLKKEHISQIPDGSWVKAVSTDESFMDAMVKLYETDPIEFQLKIQQFKTQLEQQEQIKKEQEQKSSAKDTIKCPKCGSTNITEGTKGFSLITGFIGSGNFRYVCKKCGNKWKP